MPCPGRGTQAGTRGGYCQKDQDSPWVKHHAEPLFQSKFLQIEEKGDGNGYKKCDRPLCEHAEPHGCKSDKQHPAGACPVMSHDASMVRARKKFRSASAMAAFAMMVTCSERTSMADPRKASRWLNSRRAKKNIAIAQPPANRAEGKRRPNSFSPKVLMLRSCIQ